MKKINRFLFILALCTLLFSSCYDLTGGGDDDPPKEEECVYGTLVVSNESIQTIHKIIIDGTSYGTLDAGETKRFSLPEGKYELKFSGITGGSGCSPAFVTIVPCKVTGRSCRH